MHGKKTRIWRRRARFGGALDAHFHIAAFQFELRDVLFN